MVAILIYFQLEVDTTMVPMIEPLHLLEHFPARADRGLGAACEGK